MDFDVGGSGLKISQVGVFDSNSDGLFRTITAYIYNRADGTVFAGPFSFTGNDGTLIGGSRFLDIADIDLPAGFSGQHRRRGIRRGRIAVQFRGGRYGRIHHPRRGRALFLCGHRSIWKRRTISRNA
jgi:hypothetical protein